MVLVRSMVGEVKVSRAGVFEYEFSDTDGKVTCLVKESHLPIILKNPGFVAEEAQKGSFKKLEGKQKIEV